MNLAMLIRLIAHRGNDGIDSLLVENSLEALLAASDFNEISGIEFDVRMTKDGVLVIVHDGNLRTITPSYLHLNKQIEDMTYDELMQYSLIERQSRQNILMGRTFLYNRYDGHYIRGILSDKMQQTAHITKVEDLFCKLALKGYRGECLYELKDTSDPCLQASADLIREYKELNIKVQSSNIEPVIELGRTAKVPSGIIVGSLQYNRLTSKAIEKSDADFYNIIWTQALTLSHVINLIVNNKGIYTWTNDSIRHLAGLLKLLVIIKRRYGVLPKEITIVSNFPTLLNKYLTNPNCDLWLIRRVADYYAELNGTVSELTPVEHKDKILLPHQPFRKIPNKI